MESLNKALNFGFGILLQRTEACRIALTHVSYTREHGGQHYEQLEFLGDAVLQLCVSDFLLRNFGHLREGDLTRIRHQLVDTETLTEIAQDLQLGQQIVMSRWEERDGGRERGKILADVVEALLAVLYQQQGLQACHQWTEHHFHQRALRVQNHIPPKQMLMEWSQKLYKTVPIYLDVAAEGPAHNRRFQVSVLINNEKIASAWGASKKNAQIEVAKKAIKILNIEIPPK